MTTRYHTVDVRFEFTLTDSGNRRVDRAVITVYGESEFAVLAELKRQNPDYRGVTILSTEFR